MIPSSHHNVCYFTQLDFSAALASEARQLNTMGKKMK